LIRPRRFDVPARDNYVAPKNNNKKKRGTPSAQRLVAPLALFSFADPYPARQVVRHNYCQVFSFTSDASTAAKTSTAQVLAVNDMFAPGGHQPYGRDQMAALYGRYKIRRVTIELEALSGDSLRGALVVAVYGPSAGFSYGSALLTDCAEQPNAAAIMLSSTAVTKFAQTFDIKTILGVDAREFDSDVSQYAAASGSSPTILARLALAYSGIAATSQNCTVVMRLIFETEWFDRITQAAS